LTGTRDTADNSGSATDGVCFGLCFRLFLFGDFAKLVKVTLEDCGVGYILGRLGEL
jgi:hypothetical protein